MGTPYKMKGSPMQRNFGVGSPLRKDDVVSETSPGPGYKKIKGTNIWEHTETKNNNEKLRQNAQLMAKQAGVKVDYHGNIEKDQ